MKVSSRMLQEPMNCKQYESSVLKTFYLKKFTRTSLRAHFCSICGLRRRSH